jgi:hypothetical protein
MWIRYGKNSDPVSRSTTLTNIVDDYSEAGPSGPPQLFPAWKIKSTWIFLSCYRKCDRLQPLLERNIKILLSRTGFVDEINQCCGSGSAMIWLSSIRIRNRIGHADADLDPDPGA